MDNSDSGKVPPRLDIVGAGPVGVALGIRWQSRGLRVALWERAGEVRSPRVLLDAKGQRHEFLPLKWRSQEREDSRICFLAIKAYDVVSALNEWMPELNPDRDLLVILSNGYYLGDIPAIGLPQKRILRLGLTTVGCKLQADGSFFSASWDAGKVLWGPWPEQTLSMQKVEKAVFEADANSQWSETVVLDLVRKWILNVTLNSVCAAYLLPTNGLALQLHEVLLREVFSEAWEASQQVWSRHLTEAQQLSLWGQDAKQTLLLQADLWQQLRQVIMATADNANSMYVDVLQGRRTEWAFLGGLAAKPGSRLAGLGAKIEKPK